MRNRWHRLNDLSSGKENGLPASCKQLGAPPLPRHIGLPLAVLGRVTACAWQAREGEPGASGTMPVSVSPAWLLSPQLTLSAPSTQVSSESSGGTFIYQGSVKGHGFGQFGFQRLGN